uniref:PadR family transcriptional regulator n=1 Tax=Ignisphaera aggregans TaxID=334771 RepID=A0A7C4FGY4_9CREN
MVRLMVPNDLNNTGANIDYKRCIEDPFIRGIIRVVILIALKEGGKRGYQIYQYIKSKLGHSISVSTMYTILRELTDKNFISKNYGIYTLTEKGLNALKTFIKKYDIIKKFIG